MTTLTTISSKTSKAPLLSAPPQLNIQRIGLVARDYNRDYGNGYKDFSATFREVLQHLDDAGCDAVLFSLYSFIPRKRFDVLAGLRFKHLKAICYEEFEFEDERKRKAGAIVVAVQTRSGWKQHVVGQAFGSLSRKPVSDIHQYVQEEVVHRRLLGNACLIICGESNGVKYSRAHKCVEDTFGLREALPQEVVMVLNPVHDRMTRFEMMRKRRFLSKGNRWVISVWNKGRINKLGQIRDGHGPAWTVFYNGEPMMVPRLPNPWGVEVGILQITPE
jgi:hypothetical protein